MAVPNPTDFTVNHSPLNTQSLSDFILMTRMPRRGRYTQGRHRTRPQKQSLSDFILMKRVPRKGGRKTNLGVKKLITRFEKKLVTGEQIQGSVLAVPSAPSYPENDSDCESWGSDFDDDDEDKKDLTLDPQEEMDNSINDMLEAARERNRRLQNSQFDRNETAEASPSTSNAPNTSEGLDFSARSNAPPLPPRNPPAASSASPININRENKPSAANSIPARSISSSNVNQLLSGTNKTPEKLQAKSSVQVVTPPAAVSRTAAVSASSPSTRGTPVAPTKSESSLQTTSQQSTPKFPPDISNIPNTSARPLRLPLRSSIIRAGRASPVPREEANNTPNKGASNSPKASVQNSRDRNPEISRSETGAPKGQNETSVPPPLPLRPPPVRSQLNNPAIKSSPTHASATASTSRERIPDTVFNGHPGQPFPNSAAKLQITKDVCTSLPNLVDSSKNSSVAEALTPVSSTSKSLLATQYVVKLPEKPNPKRKSLAMAVPKIIRELDAAVLKQARPKGRSKSASIGEVEHSLGESKSFSSSESSPKSEDTGNSPRGDDYLNPKELSLSRPHFEPDRPILPSRLKHARSLPLLNLVDTLKKQPSKTKITADEQNSLDLSLQQPRAVNEKTGNVPGFPAAVDEVFWQPWYHPVTWAQAQLKLTTMAQDGAFLVRPSSRGSEGVPFAISVFYKGRVINCHISSTPERKYVLGKQKPNQKTFDTITELIRFYQSTSAELRISEAEPTAKVCFLITPPKDNDKIYADAYANK